MFTCVFVYRMFKQQGRMATQLNMQDMLGPQLTKCTVKSAPARPGPNSLKTERSKAKQNRAEHSKTTENKAKQNKTLNELFIRKRAKRILRGGT